MTEVEEEHKIFKRLPSCKIELKYIKDIFYFIGFLLVTILIRVNRVFNFIEIAIYIGIGFAFSMGATKSLSRIYITLVSLFVSLMLVVPTIEWDLSDILEGVISLCRIFVYVSMWFSAGAVGGSISKSILNYVMCQRGETF